MSSHMRPMSLCLLTGVDRDEHIGDTNTMRDSQHRDGNCKRDECDYLDVNRRDNKLENSERVGERNIIIIINYTLIYILIMSHIYILIISCIYTDNILYIYIY